jgi:hypothetical protein
MKLLTRTVITVALTIPVTAVVSPVEASYEWKCPKYTQQIRQHFPKRDWRTMDAIMWRESRCITRAVGWNYRPGTTYKDCQGRGDFHTRRRCPAVRSYDVGLFQITSSWRTLTRQVCGKDTTTKVLMRPQCNFRVARVLYNHGGLDHWRGTSHKERQP